MTYIYMNIAAQIVSVLPNCLLAIKASLSFVMSIEIDILLYGFTAKRRVGSTKRRCQMNAIFDSAIHVLKIESRVSF